MHQGDILAIDDGVHCQITLDAMLVTLFGDITQVVDREGRGGVSAHVQLLDTEIDAVSTCLNGCCHRLARANGRHDFKVLYCCIHQKTYPKLI